MGESREDCHRNFFECWRHSCGRLIFCLRDGPCARPLSVLRKRAGKRFYLPRPLAGEVARAKRVTERGRVLRNKKRRLAGALFVPYADDLRAFVRYKVHQQFADVDDGLGVAFGAAHHGMDAGDKLVLVKGLRHIIIGAETEATDLVLNRGKASDFSVNSID
jgi:hypothetical protein